MKAKCCGIVISIAGVVSMPAHAFKVIGDDTLPVLQTDDGQPFAGWDVAIGKCLGEVRSKPQFGFNCNQRVTDALAQQDAQRQIQALNPYLRDGVIRASGFRTFPLRACRFRYSSGGKVGCCPNSGRGVLS